jgi:hypothetical protein
VLLVLFATPTIDALRTTKLSSHEQRSKKPTKGQNSLGFSKTFYNLDHNSNPILMRVETWHCQGKG